MYRQLDLGLRMTARTVSREYYHLITTAICLKAHENQFPVRIAENMDLKSLAVAGPILDV